MPFLDDAGAPLDPVPLLYRGGRLFQLEKGFVWIDPRDDSRVEVAPHDPSRPASETGNGTDLASVPPFLWGLIASYGRQTMPAILHDRLVDAVDVAPIGERDALQRRADDIFRVALIEAGIPDARAVTMWATVRVASVWNRHRARGTLLIAQLVLGVAASITAVGLAASGHPLALLLLLAPGLAALLWGGDRGFVIAAAYLAALYSPLIIAAAVASAIEYLASLVLWLVSGRRGSAPRPGPQVAPDRSGR